jgi:hypothetical protein
MSQLKGADHLRKRINALQKAFKPIGRQWGDRTVRNMKPSIPILTGETRRSIRVKNNTKRYTRVVGSYKTAFIDAGTKAHDEVPKHGLTLAFPVGGSTVFARKVHQRGLRARPFKARAARQALADTPYRDILIKEWNEAG